MLRRYTRLSCLFACLAVCFAAGNLYHKYVGLPATLVFLKAPLASTKILRRDWTASKQLQYTLDRSDLNFTRYVQTGLLPLVINGKRLSDYYPVTKFGGAITVVGKTIVIMDRLGSWYSYDVKTGTFGKLRLPLLPNNFEAYLRQRPSLDGVKHTNLAGPESNFEFRAHDITFLPDRKALAALYDQFDEKLGKLRTAVSVIPIDVATLTATGVWQTIFTSEAYAPGLALFAGGRMAYRGNNRLYLSIGDHGIYSPEVSQDPNTAFGKVIELNLASTKWREISKGLRNAEGLTFTKAGQLIATDNGPRGGDSLDVIIEDNNFGWPRVSLGTAYDSYEFTRGAFSMGSGPERGRSPIDPSLVGRISNYTAPLFAWVPSIAPSQLIQIDNFDPRWNGDLLVGSMKGESLFRLRLEADRVLYSEPIWIGQRIRDLTQTGDGTIVIWTDDTQLLFVSVDNDKLAQKRLASAFLGDVEFGGCLSCHHFGPTNPGDAAPTLSNLLDRPIASDAFPYSRGLRALHGNWTKPLLMEFLTDPNKFDSGTVMPSMRMLGLNSEQIENIVEKLAQASKPVPGQQH